MVVILVGNAPGNKGFKVNKLIIPVAVFIGSLVGSSFLSGAGVGYFMWYPLPEPISRAVVTISTLYAFAKMFIFIATLLFSRLKKDI